MECKEKKCKGLKRYNSHTSCLEMSNNFPQKQLFINCEADLEMYWGLNTTLFVLIAGHIKFTFPNHA